jgi:hypothetical protein
MKDRLLFLHPEHLDATGLADRIDAELHVVANTLDFIVDRQFWATVCRTERDGIVNFPVPISAKVLRQQRGRRTTDALKELSAAGVLRRSRYEVGVSPFEYWFPPGSSKRTYDLGTTTLKRSDIHHNAFDALRRKLSETDIDLNSDHEHLPRMAQVAQSIRFEEDLVLDDSLDARSVKAITDYRNGNLYFRQRGYSNRLYHSFGSLPKKLRRWCLMGSEHTAELDIDNGQWFFLACDLLGAPDALLCDRGASCFHEPNPCEANPNANTAKRNAGDGAGRGDALPYMMEGNPSLKPSTRRFIECCAEGTVYELFRQLIDPCYQNPATREQAKKCGVILLNGDLADLEQETYFYKGNESPNAVHFC